MSGNESGARPQQPPIHILLACKLSNYDVVSEQEMSVLEQAIRGFRSFETGQELVMVDDRPSHSSILVEGWAARAKTLEDGGRQITAIHVPGDFVDLHSFLLRKMDHSVVALSPCRTASVPHERLRGISETQPHLTRLLWLNTLVDAAIHRNWIVAMGRMSASGRMAQLLCELYVRLSAVELAGEYEFEFPLTQPVVADALGLSLVHVNRSLREIRGRNLIAWRSRIVKILDWERLVEFAQFDPTYLSLRREPR
jgi:CRP-like cAMP-binding protein